jgi:hypothetical protein
MKAIRKCSVFFLLTVLTIGALAIKSPMAQEMPDVHFINGNTGSRITDKVIVEEGTSTTIRLMGTVPKDMKLKAYSATIRYDAALVEIDNIKKPQNSVFPPLFVNGSEKGTVKFNAFDIKGVSGPARVAFIDFSIKGSLVGDCKLSVVFDSFGESQAKQYIPAELTVDIKVVK